MNGVSVIICCYNSADRIVETLRFLVAQKQGDFPWEIVVVNNGSTDATAQLVSDFAKAQGTHSFIKVVQEPAPGLASARKKGIRESAYDLLIFCDDDNHFDESYVVNAYDAMNKYPEAGIAGGDIRPKLPFYPGKWIEANYAALAIGSKGAEAKYVDWVFGAGMVIRKEVFRKLESMGIKMMLSGRRGTSQTSGDDAEICQLARFIGYQVLYSPRLVLEHKIASHRLSRISFIRANYKNVFHAVYLYLLEEGIRQKNADESVTFKKFLRSRISQILYFGPRVFFGKNNFFSFMMFFQNCQLVLWLLKHRQGFRDTFNSIKNNLSQQNLQIKQAAES